MSFYHLSFVLFFLSHPVCLHYVELCSLIVPVDPFTDATYRFICQQSLQTNMGILMSYVNDAGTFLSAQCLHFSDLHTCFDFAMLFHVCRN